ncbi:MAG: N-formylglutamate amidohydrolase [Dongiaceae bacterium]
MKLLAPEDPPPFELFNGQGRAPVMLLCDHARRFIPASLRQLDLSGEDLVRHIAWDIGAADITRHMALRLDAPAVLCNYSRLIIDCNRLLRDPTLIPPESDGSAIPGNAALSAADRQARLDAIYVPYHRAIEDLAETMRVRHGVAAMLAIHSCTDRMNGQFRPWEIGICWEGDDRIAAPVMAALQGLGSVTVGDNQPYGLVTGEDCSLPIHGMRRGWPHLQLEFRQDLIGTEVAAQKWADILFAAIQPTLARSDVFQARFYEPAG